jgi:tetratricopeptide (TPR) repeat protein
VTVAEPDFERTLEELYQAWSDGEPSRIRSVLSIIKENYGKTPEAYAYQLRNATERADLTRANEFANKIPEESWDEPVVLASRARLASFEGRADEARSLARRAYRFAPTHPLVLAYASETLQRTGDLDEATEIARAWVALRPKDCLGHERLSRLYWDARNLDEVAKYLQTPPEAFANTFWYHRFGWRVELTSHQTERALAHARSAAALAPWSAKDVGMLAFTLTRVGAFAEAVQVAQKALELDPRNTSALGVLAAEARKRGDEEEVRRLEGLRPARSARHLEAKKFHDASLLRGQARQDAYREIEENANSRESRIGSVAPRLGSLIHEKKLAEVEHIAVMLQKEDPRNEYTFVARWAVSHLNDRHDEALAIARSGLATYPNSAGLRGREMQSLAMLGRGRDAAKIAAAFIASPPDSPGSCHGVLACMIYAGRLLDALTFIDAAKRKYPHESFDESQRKIKARVKEIDEERMAKLSPLARWIVKFLERFLGPK